MHSPNVTNLRPDIFVVNETSRLAIIFELFCPWDTNIVCIHEFKENKYAPLVVYLSCQYRAFHFSLEISV